METITTTTTTIVDDHQQLYNHHHLHHDDYYTQNLSQIADIYPISDREHVLFSLVYYLISTVSVAGNSLIILAIFINKSMHNVTNYFITNLAIADIIISIFCTPFQVLISLICLFQSNILLLFCFVLFLTSTWVHSLEMREIRLDFKWKIRKPGSNLSSSHKPILKSLKALEIIYLF